MHSLRFLAGIVDLPYATPGGRVVTRAGYDAETRLYLHLPTDYAPGTPDKPDAETVRAAVAQMMSPWREYSFASPDAAAGMVSAVFAALSRPMLDIAPAYLLDACQPGSGKTKAATALGALIEGRRAAVTPYSGATNEEELKKRFIASAIDGTRFICVDNCFGLLKSAVLAGVLTSGRLKDRILGRSQDVEARFKAFLTLTANNMDLTAEIQRRTVQIRIDAGINPTHRAFDFCPMSEALSQRRQIGEAACVVWRAYFNAGAPSIVNGDAGGFADWNRLCRQPVLWLASEGLEQALPWSLGDPAASMLADASNSDPESEATGDFLRALWALTDGADFAASEAVKWHAAGQHCAEDEPCGLLRSAVLECCGRADVTARAMGRVLMHRRDRPTGGLKLLARSARGPMKSWRVVQVGD